MLIDVTYGFGFPIKDENGNNKTTLRFNFTQSQFEGFIVSFLFRKELQTPYSFKNLDTSEVVDYDEVERSHRVNTDAVNLEELNESISPNMGNRLLIYEEESLMMIIQYSSEFPHNREFLLGLKTGIKLLDPEFDLDMVKYEKNHPFTIEQWNKISENSL